MTVDCQAVLWKKWALGLAARSQANTGPERVLERALLPSSKVAGQSRQSRIQNGQALQHFFYYVFGAIDEFFIRSY
jgi:hypothetical protein